MFNYYVYINIVSCEPIISLFHLLYNFKILIWSSIAFLIFFFYYYFASGVLSMLLQSSKQCIFT